jgi:hypothetical protein
MPIPPRYWWLKRLGAAGLLWVLLLVGVRWWWGWEAERRLQAKIAEYRAEGEPVEMEDFVLPALPDERNGAYYLQLAVQHLSPAQTAQTPASADLEDPETCLRSPQALGQHIEANAETLRLIHEARLRPDASWTYTWTSPLVTAGFFTSFGPQRRLAKLACAAAVYHHSEADDAAAVAAMHDVFALSRHTARREPCSINMLVCAAIDGLAVRTLERIAPRLAVAGQDAAATAPPGPASRRDVAALVAELLNEQRLRRDWVRNQQSERLFCLDTCRVLSSGQTTITAVLGGIGPAVTFDLAALGLFAPAWTLDVVRLMESRTRQAQTGLASSLSAAKALSPNPPTRVSAPDQVAHWLSTLSEGVALRMIEIHFRSLAGRRMAAIALAIRLYETDHGQRPESLSDLVPDYLPGVPHDPFDPTDGPIRYLPHAGLPILYSVGANETDDGGSYQRFGDGRVNTRFSNDLPCLLDDVLAAPAATTSTIPGATQAASSEAAHDHREPEQRRGDDQEQEQ